MPHSRMHPCEHCLDIGRIYDPNYSINIHYSLYLHHYKTSEPFILLMRTTDRDPTSRPYWSGRLTNAKFSLKNWPLASHRLDNYNTLDSYRHRRSIATRKFIDYHFRKATLTRQGRPR